MKPTIFSRVFPGYHPRKGEPTGFVKSILYQQGILINEDYVKLLLNLNADNLFIKLSYADIILFVEGLKAEDDPFYDKKHTIRGGNRWKQGDYFSPRVWSGKPYCSPQIIFAPPIEIKKLLKYEVKIVKDKYEQFFLNDTPVSESDNEMKYWWNAGLIKQISQNDGLELVDFLNWFKHPSPFQGQIICWDENVNY